MEKIKASLDNFATQLLAFQQQIIDRDGVPTDKEMAFQVKTVNAMAKLEKMIARDAAVKARELREQQKQEKQLARSRAEDAPISEEDFDEYSDFICSRQQLEDWETIEFKGSPVNACWLEYNLFQYMLPAAERSFIYYANHMHRINYHRYRVRMFDIINQREAA